MKAIDDALEALRETAQRGFTSGSVEALGQPGERRRALAEALAAELPPGARTLDADALDDADGAYDVIHVAALHTQMHPHAFLERLAALLSPGGSLLVGSVQLPDVEHSELARFLPGEESTWWVPGRLCLRWMVEAAGVTVIAESEAIECGDGLVFRYVRAEKR